MSAIFRILRPALLAGTALCAAALPAQEVTLTLPPGDEDLRDAIEGNALTFSLGAQEDTRPADYIAAARADYRRILTALYAEGRYGGTISIRVDGREASSIAPLDAPGSLQSVDIAVTPGPLFTFGGIAIAPVTPATVLPPELAAGAVARSTVIEAAVGAAVEGWRQEGHALAQPGAQDIRAIHAGNRLDVGVAIVPGPQLTFGPVAVSGNENVRTARVLEIAGLPVGRVYDPDDIDLAETRLRRTGAFASVAVIESEVPGPGDTLPLEVQVSEMAPRRLGFGAEISSTEGLSVNAFWLHRNLLGGAERFRIDAAVTGIQTAIPDAEGGPDYSIALSYARPATVHPDVDITADLAIERLDEADYRLDQIVGDVSFIRYVRDDLTYNGGFGFITAHEETSYRTRDYTLVTMPLGATLDRRDNAFDATSGYYVDVTATPFLGLAGADDGGRLFVDGRYYRSFGAEDRFTLAVRGQVGSVWGADLMQAPQDFLFYSGGGGTVRGQPYQDLGISITRDIGGGTETIRLGGRSFVGLQAEARVDLFGNFGAVAFYDFGAIDVDSIPDADSQWHAGAGIGLRYATGIGPIRLDIATPASGDDAGQSVQIYIGIGQAF